MSGKDLKFSFNFETKNKVLAEIHNLDKKKACQESDIPVKIIKTRYLMQLSPQN